jgi:signal transduction histidine kinase
LESKLSGGADYQDFSSLAFDLNSFKRQESTIIILNLFLLAGLLLLQTLFASRWGNPSKALVVALGVGFLLKTAELIWLQGLTELLQPKALLALTWGSVVLNLSLALLLTALTDHEDSPYFVLMVVPILETAFRSRLPLVLAVISVAGYLNFFWVWRYFRRHPPLEISEYFEAGITSLIFAVVGLLVWLLVNQLRQHEARIAQNLRELEQTRERLLQEEKLAAVGRLSSAIAHEIRNPVAMISSSLATAMRGSLDADQRKEMFEIAAKESSRLEKLTTEFLSYARPRPPEAFPNPIGETLGYIVDVCRAHAHQRGVELEIRKGEELTAQMDPAQVQQALLNIVMNAVEASSAGGVVLLRAESNGSESVHIDVENQGQAIPNSTLARVFEPFFTTKPHGTGLGLAIARNIARANGGDLILAANQPDRVCFSLRLPMPKCRQQPGKGKDGPDPDR